MTEEDEGMGIMLKEEWDAIPKSEHLRCPTCGEDYWWPSDSKCDVCDVKLEKVTETLECRKCGEIIPSTYEEMVKHMIRKHGERGTFIYNINIVRSCFKKALQSDGGERE